MKILGKEDKWLLVSCLQKSIRKGFADLAVSYAEKLFDIERSYLLYRLSIIAVEDIGLGNLDAVHDFMSTQIKKSNIDQRGGKEYVMNVVRTFANSVKDRSAYDLTELTSFHTTSLILKPQELEDLFLNDEKAIVNRMIAGWEILGAQKLKNNIVLNKNDDIEKFIQLNEKIVKNEKVIDIMKNGYLIHREPHFIALGLLSYLYEQEKGKKMGKYLTGSFVEKKFTSQFLDDSWLIDGIDWHTKEGKSAITAFCDQPSATLQALKLITQDESKIAQAMGMLLFRHCGDDVDKRLVYPSAVVILKLTKQAAFQKLMNNEKVNFADIAKIFTQDFPLLKIFIEESFDTPDPKFFPF